MVFPVRDALKSLAKFNVDAQYVCQFGSQLFNSWQGVPQKEKKEAIDSIIKSISEIGQELETVKQFLFTKEEPKGEK